MTGIANTAPRTPSTPVAVITLLVVTLGIGGLFANAASNQVDVDRTSCSTGCVAP